MSALQHKPAHDPQAQKLLRRWLIKRDDLHAEAMFIEPSFIKAHLGGLLFGGPVATLCLWLLLRESLSSLLEYLPLTLLTLLGLSFALGMPCKWFVEHRRLLKLQEANKLNPKLLSDLE